jgi:hypothetical protein
MAGFNWKIVSSNKWWARLILTVAACCEFAACGLVVPDIKEIWDTDKPADPVQQQPRVPGAAQIEWEIKKRIFCDLKRAVYNVSHIPVTEDTYGHLTSTHGRVTKRQPGLIPSNWQAQISLTLQVDEQSALAPGVTITHLLPNASRVFGPNNTFTTSQSSSLGFGGTLSSTATRIDKFDPYYSVEYLLEDDPHSVCIDGNDPLDQPGWRPDRSSPFIIESDLGIENWLEGAMIVDNWLPSVGSPPQALGGGGGKGPAGGGGGGGKSPAAAGGGAGTGSKSKSDGGSSNKNITKDTITYEVKFVIVSTGSVTPTWKLIRVSANTSGNLFSTGRTRTHDLIITLGPPTAATAQTHFASQLGNAVSNGNRATFGTLAPAGIGTLAPAGL